MLKVNFILFYVIDEDVVYSLSTLARNSIFVLKKHLRELNGEGAKSVYVFNSNKTAFECLRHL